MTSRRSIPWLLLVVLAALALRVVLALHKGLVLDEFHSYFHATRAGLGPFLDTLLQDNHPPLSFLLIGGSANALGDGELALRLPAILAGLLELALVARLARPLGPNRVALAVALVAFSTLHLDYSSQARMYAFLSLAITGVTVALVEHLGGAPGRRRWMVGWFVFGLHSHYYTVHYSLILAAAVLAMAGLDSSLRPRVRALVPASLLAMALCAPWLLWGLRVQLQHALPPGGDDVGLVALGQALGHLFYINVFLAGEARGAMLLGAGLLLGLAGAGLLAGWRSDRQRTGVLAVTAFGVPLFAMALALCWSRAGFTWQYILPSTAPIAVLAATGVTGNLGRGLAGYALLTLLWLAGLQFTGRGSEDFPGAVARVLELHEPGDVVVSVELQPTFFPQGQPWDYYAPRLQDNPPQRLEMRGVHVVDHEALDRATRVLLVVSKLPAGVGVRRQLERDRELVLQEDFGFGRRVLVYE